jgi:hypothetical protein
MPEPTYSFAGQEVPIQLLDLVYDKLSEFHAANIPLATYQPFLKELLTELSSPKFTGRKSTYINRKCAEFIAAQQQPA